MHSAISRYGARVLPDTEQIAQACKARGEYIQGPQIAEFERAFERRAGRGTAITAAYGRIAFYYMLKALDLPPGSEIIFPSLTFWVVPELAKVDSNIYGIALVTTDGKVYTAGDVKSQVSIQSISKVFTMAKVIEEQGPEAIASTIGVDATGMRFHSIVSIEFSKKTLGGPEMN